MVLQAAHMADLSCNPVPSYELCNARNPDAIRLRLLSLESAGAHQ